VRVKTPDRTALTNWSMERTRVLLCRVRTRLCAVPLEHVVETMRPLRVESFAGMPSFIKGVSLIRGAPVPVVDAGALLGTSDDAQPARFVAVRAGQRRVALAVEEVLGVRELPAATLHSLPPLLHDASADVVSAVGTLDQEFLVVLQATRFVLESQWQLLDNGGGAT
jgi:purine-binding chemotaxis protein CheW